MGSPARDGLSSGLGCLVIFVLATLLLFVMGLSAWMEFYESILFLGISAIIIIAVAVYNER